MCGSCASGTASPLGSTTEGKHASTLKEILSHFFKICIFFSHSFAPYGEFLEAKLQSEGGYRALDVDTIGFSAWTTKQMVANMDSQSGRDGVGKKWPGLKVALEDEKSQKKQVDLVILMAGTNDVGHRYEREVGALSTP